MNHSTDEADQGNARRCASVNMAEVASEESIMRKAAHGLGKHAEKEQRGELSQEER